MNEFPAMALAAVAGTLLGTIFFAGLWWTVQKAMRSGRPALWLFGSALLRMSIALSGFYAVAGGQWERLLACLVGFIGARYFVNWLTGPRRNGGIPAPREARHAP